MYTWKYALVNWGITNSGDGLVPNVPWTNTDLLSTLNTRINKLQWNRTENAYIFFDENTLQNVVC